MNKKETNLEEGQLDVLERQALHEAGEDGLQPLIEGAGREHRLLRAAHLFFFVW